MHSPPVLSIFKLYFSQQKDMYKIFRATYNLLDKEFDIFSQISNENFIMKCNAKSKLELVENNRV